MSARPPLSQQVIIITGSSVGIGAALARLLARRFPSIRLALAARRVDRLEAVAMSCRSLGANVFVKPTDVADSQQVTDLVRSVIDRWGQVDALVNNAGYGQMGPLELMPPTVAEEQFAVNFYAPLILTQSLIPLMRESGGGRIVNVSSLGGRMAFPGAGLYSASKFALEALSDVLRMELEGFNIQVSVVEPGPVVTEFFEAAWQKVLKTIPEPEKSLYSPVFEKIAGIDRQLAVLGWTADRVAEVILRSLSDRHPRPRYYAATGGAFFVPMMTKFMPTWFTDAFWKRIYGIDRLERNWNRTYASTPYVVSFC
jgi:short-subunit dehydrogenase